MAEGLVANRQAVCIHAAVGVLGAFYAIAFYGFAFGGIEQVVAGYGVVVQRAVVRVGPFLPPGLRAGQNAPIRGR